MSSTACTNCNHPAPDDPRAYRCKRCGGLFDFVTFPAPDHAELTSAGRSVWRFRSALGLPPDAPVISLGEGGTPLVEAETRFGRVAFKLEYTNPTGSHKDRGVALMTSLLKHQGVTEAVEDSSGNAGASFAAYAAHAGIRARIFVPAYASGPKRDQIEAYGAELIAVPGKRSDVAEAVARAADGGAVYASHAHRPQLLPGFATLAYELFAELGAAPALVIAPVGQGTLLLGIGLGFRNLLKAGLIPALPRLVGVQAMACAPVWAGFTMGLEGMQWVIEGETAAEGVRVRYPLRGDAVMRMIAETNGTVLAVEEERIAPARGELARLGLYVEPTSAIVWDALRQLGPGMTAAGPVVAVLTGSGLKARPSTTPV